MAATGAARNRIRFVGRSVNRLVAMLRYHDVITLLWLLLQLLLSCLMLLAQHHTICRIRASGSARRHDSGAAHMRRHERHGGKGSNGNDHHTQPKHRTEWADDRVTKRTACAHRYQQASLRDCACSRRRQQHVESLMDWGALRR